MEKNGVCHKANYKICHILKQVQDPLIPAENIFILNLFQDKILTICVYLRHSV